MAIDLDTLTQRRAGILYAQGNGQGHGWAPAEEDVDASIDALVAEGFAVHFARNTSDEVAVLVRGDEVVAVGDANGAWAVTISDEEVSQ
jgi:hypothetical protein